MKRTRTRRSPRQAPRRVLAVALCMPALALAAGCTGRSSVEPTPPTASTAPAERVPNPGDPSFGVGATADTLDQRTYLLNEAFDGQNSTLALSFTAEGALYIVSDCGQQQGNYRLTEDRLSIDPIPDGMQTTCTPEAAAQLHDVLSALAATPALRTNANMLAIVTDTDTFRLLERDPDAPLPPPPSLR